ncbi:3-phosphoshikimate 1-carboxyvinyltransferase [Schlesneria sp. T3-172]|uniref:3-phosphoshikimate 1-carboxyvinyltransferase n=1 Tax=Schlesneria sphaerica TaxID=3373610 RepID=UPI0037C6B0B0
MTPSREIQPVCGPVNGSIRPPGSKSLTNRALVVAALASGTSHLTGVLDSRDTQVMIDSLKRLGLTVDHDAAKGTVRIDGCHGNPPTSAADLWLENSGTSIRFLTALCALGQGRYRLDGNSRMRERPIADLVVALRQFGIEVECELGNDCPPVLIHGQGLPGGTISIKANLSSQFLSAVLMAAPCAQQTVEIRLAGELVSEPYIEMTLAVMSQFGVNVDRPEAGVYRITPQTYVATTYDIEPDASAASYFFGLAAVTQGNITVNGLNANALQGDVHFVRALEQMGCQVTWNADSVTVQGRPLQGIDIDMNAISDTAQTLACVAPFATGPTRIRNVAHMRLKETDRVTAVVTELQKLGCRVEEHPDGMTIHPGPLHGGTVATYDDHRMAMSFSLIGLRVPGIIISDPGCTSKTYPNYFEDLERLCGKA